MATDRTYNTTLPDGNCDFDPKAVAALNAIIEQVPNLEFIISSTWRLGETVESFQKILDVRGVIGARITGITPRVMILVNNGRTSSAPRGCEIQQVLNDVAQELWPFHPGLTMREEYELRKQTPYSYLILDDDGDMLYWQRKNFIQTNGHKGLQMSDVPKAIKILNMPIIL